MKKILVLVGFLFTVLSAVGCSQLPARDLSSNPIQDCTGGPHCVTTRTQNSDRKIQPFLFNGTSEDFKKIAVSTIESMPHSHIVRAEQNYIYAEYTSAIMRFVDDFEVYWDPQTKMVDMRSSSRIGYNDLGVNQKRTEKFQQLFLQKIR